MNLYLLTQNKTIGYDTYDSCVVISESEEDAKTIHPHFPNPKWDSLSWCKNPSQVEVEFIGTAKEGSVRGVVCASFNAG
jgi:hypothetical protein